MRRDENGAIRELVVIFSRGAGRLPRSFKEQLKPIVDGVNDLATTAASARVTSDDIALRSLLQSWEQREARLRAYIERINARLGECGHFALADLGALPADAAFRDGIYSVKNLPQLSGTTS